MTKILFLDLDGTIRRTKSGATFINKPEDQEIIPGVQNAIIRYLNYHVIGITNQGGVAAGKKSLEDALAEQKYTMQLLPELKLVYFCPDFDGDLIYKVSCEKHEAWERHQFLDPISNKPFYQSFRKPGAGMVQKAINDLGKIIDAKSSLFVGDACGGLRQRSEDEQCALAANIPFTWANNWRGE
ncbi:polynucleotide kinase [Nostoc sp. MG11]|uniref:polynucleotide kinase n=1 Tax=Nostoc sp. MG11 TaxID=2721166 RepID=UPI0018671FC7|nr:polynucleotide kinase [Nostoc sp. MG11]